MNCFLGFFKKNVFIIVPGVLGQLFGIFESYPRQWCRIVGQKVSTCLTPPPRGAFKGTRTAPPPLGGWASIFFFLLFSKKKFGCWTPPPLRDISTFLNTKTNSAPLILEFLSDFNANTSKCSIYFSKYVNFNFRFCLFLLWKSYNEHFKDF